MKKNLFSKQVSKLMIVFMKGKYIHHLDKLVRKQYKRHVISVHKQEKTKEFIKCNNMAPK